VVRNHTRLRKRLSRKRSISGTFRKKSFIFPEMHGGGKIEKSCDFRNDAGGLKGRLTRKKKKTQFLTRMEANIADRARQEKGKLISYFLH